MSEIEEKILEKDKEILDLKLQLKALSSYYDEIVKKYADVVNEVISIKSTIVSQSIELVKDCVSDLKNFLYKLDLIKDTQDCDGKYVFEKFIEEYIKSLEEEDE